MTTLAWHFVGDTLRDGRPVPPDGEWLIHEGEIAMCESGLHASRKLIDALLYAPGSTICRVAVDGIENEGCDKLVARKRVILWRISNADAILRQFAREVAFSVIHLWDAPEVVRRYLKTGDETLRAAALAAARAAAARAAAAGDAALAAALAAARVAAPAAAGDAALAAAAGDAARVAAGAAARDAAEGAALAAAGDAAWDAATAKLEGMVREAAGNPAEVVP